MYVDIFIDELTVIPTQAASNAVKSLRERTSVETTWEASNNRKGWDVSLTLTQVSPDPKLPGFYHVAGSIDALLVKMGGIKASPLKVHVTF